MFKQAIKHESKLRLAIAGPSGSGKTYTALAVGTSMGRVALLDTERGSASKYADLFTFDVLELEPPFHPDRFIEVINAASAAGYDVLVLDSLTHAWNGQGGLLEIVDEISRRMRNPNSFAAWKDATPIQNRLIDALTSAKIHIIATMRSKQEYSQEKDEKTGRMVVRKLGMAPIQRDGMEYEFDIVLDMDIDNTAVVSKTRCSALTGRAIQKPGKALADTLQEWLGGEPAPVVISKPVVNGNGYAVGAEVVVMGKNDEKPGTVRGFDGDLVIVQVDGADLKVKPERVKVIAPLFSDEEE